MNLKMAAIYVITWVVVWPCKTTWFTLNFRNIFSWFEIFKVELHLLLSTFSM